MAKSNSSRLPVLKTYKLFIGGQFPRSESGRSKQALNAKGQLMANIALASRKDFKMAVSAAKKAQAGWAKRSAFNRGQILYRMAEMLETRRALFIDSLIQDGAYKENEAIEEVDKSIDRLVWYAGWCDKYAQVLGNINPVATSHFNFSFPEALGIVAILSPREAPLLGLVSTIAPVILSGNAAVVIVDNLLPTLGIELAEVFATSDLPGGVVNMLTSDRDSLVSHVGSHMEVNGIFSVGSSQDEKALLQEAASESIKRCFFVEDGPLKSWLLDEKESPYWILPFTETKTAWHPIGS